MRQTSFFILCAVLLAGCAAPQSAENPTYDTEPDTAAPRLSFLWHEQLTSWEYLGSEPKEFAVPSHVGSTDELVVTTSEGEVLKLQASNGKVLWHHRNEGVYHAGAVVGGQRAYVGTLEGDLRAVELHDGKTVWATQLANSIESRGAYKDGRLFVSDAADVLHAFDATTGEELWTHSREVPEYFTVKGTCTPVIDKDAVYCGFSDGHLVALQIDTGEVLWESDLTGGAKNFVDIDGAVKVIGERIYAASYAGGVYALERATGAPIWRAPLESTSNYVIAGMRMYVASAIGRVVALDIEEGEPMWSFKLRDSFPGSLVVFGPYLMAFATDGPLYVLDAETGYPHSKWRGTSGFAADAEFGSSRVYAITNHGQLLGLRLAY